MHLEDLSPAELTQIDAEKIEAYNRHAPAQFKLHTELGPALFEGDVETAGIVLLLANPGFDGTSTLDDHNFQREGWPLSGLHPDAPAGLRDWWHLRLRELIQRFGAQPVSRQIAALQITPWASNKFDSALDLPSRPRVLALASRMAERGAVLLVMRAERLWEESPGVKQCQNRYRVNSWRSSYVSSGNLPPAAWQKVNAVLERAS